MKSTSLQSLSTFRPESFATPPAVLGWHAVAAKLFFNSFRRCKSTPTYFSNLRSFRTFTFWLHAHTLHKSSYDIDTFSVLITTAFSSRQPDYCNSRQIERIGRFLGYLTASTTPEYVTHLVHDMMRRACTSWATEGLICSTGFKFCFW